MCFVTATELKKNLSYYLSLAQTEEVHITKNKKVIAVLSNPKLSGIERLLALKGCLKDIDDGRPYDEMIGEEIMKKCGY